MAELVDDDEERASRKYAKATKKQSLAEAQLLGTQPLDPS